MSNLFKKLVAYLNRHGVTLNLNPLEFGIVPAEVFLPLSIIMLVCVAIGAVIGGVIVKVSIFKTTSHHPRALVVAKHRPGDPEK